MAAGAPAAGGLDAIGTSVRAHPPGAFLTVNRFCMARLYARAGRLIAENGGSRPGQVRAYVYGVDPTAGQLSWPPAPMAAPTGAAADAAAAAASLDALTAQLLEASAPWGGTAELAAAADVASETEPELQLGVEVEAEPELEPEPELVSGPEPEPQLELEVELEPEPELDEDRQYLIVDKDTGNVYDMRKEDQEPEPESGSEPEPAARAARLYEAYIVIGASVQLPEEALALLAPDKKVSIDEGRLAFCTTVFAPYWDYP
jgi:hypothetical protein